jgi:hypothetical protein
MKGWKEKEFANRDLLAPCGLYCGTCAVYIATRDDNDKFKKAIGGLYGTPIEETRCLGCMQADPPGCLYVYCQHCRIRDCIREKGYDSCHRCNDWPCEMIETFGLATGRRVMRRAIPAWREKMAEHGHEKGSVEWARSECERYHCSACGEPLFRGAQRCRACGRDVASELDGSL